MTYLDIESEQKWKKIENPIWTDERVRRLRALSAEGDSASIIAGKLGFATRNAVIGKMHRLGIVKPIQQDQRSELRHRKPGSNVRPVHVNPQRVHAHRQRPIFPDTPPTPPIHLAPSEFDKAIPQEQRLTLLQLNGHTCKWPVGSPGQPDFFFCGGYTNDVYCPHHHIRAVKQSW